MEFLNNLDANAWIQAGAMLLLAIVMVGGWKIAKPAVDNWMKQYSALLDYTLEMTKAMGEINANLQRLNASHDKHEVESERRHGELVRGLGGDLRRK